MQDYINKATASWLDLLIVEPVYAVGSSWAVHAAIIDLGIVKATDVYFYITVLGDNTTIDISVLNAKEHCFSFQQATVTTQQLFDLLMSYGNSIPTAIKQYLG